ncbi:MAG: protein kinase [Coxiellaceae bacterium]|nr:protein kinase [Coxiellaceae bacterium]
MRGSSELEGGARGDAHSEASRSSTPRARSAMQTDSDVLRRLDDVAGCGAQGIVARAEVPLEDGSNKAVVTKRGKFKERDIMYHLNSGGEDKATTHVVSLVHATEPDPEGLCELTISACELGSLGEQPLAGLDKDSRNLYLLGVVLPDVVQGLKHMHEKRIMHLDLKPENIFLYGAGRACIGDFGHSEFNPFYSCRDRSVEISVSGRHVGVGSPYYMPPEEITAADEGTFIDYKSDIWSLGVMLGKLTQQEVGLVDYHELHTGIIPGLAGRGAQTRKLIRAADARVGFGESGAKWKADSAVSRVMIATLVKEAREGKVTQLSTRGESVVSSDVSVVLSHLSLWLTAPKEHRPNILELAGALETIQSLLPKVQVVVEDRDHDGKSSPTIVAVKPVVTSSPTAGGGLFTPAAAEGSAGGDVVERDVVVPATPPRP